MRFIVIMAAIFVVPLAQGQDVVQICARDFAADGFDMCETSPQPRYVYVQGENADRPKVCVSTYPDSNCKNLKKEFMHAITLDGKIVCVLNFNQPEIGTNHCATDPKRYVYVKDPWA